MALALAMVEMLGFHVAMQYKQVCVLFDCWCEVQQFV